MSGEASAVRSAPAGSQSTPASSAPKRAFLHGDPWAYLACLMAVVIGATLVLLIFPKKQEELEVHAKSHAQDGGEAACVEEAIPMAGGEVGPAGPAMAGGKS